LMAKQSVNVIFLNGWVAVGVAGLGQGCLILTGG
jgi:hypothetical protein